ncbi:MAG: GerMN domain-containing protein [Bacillota bacterium]
MQLSSKLVKRVLVLLFVASLFLTATGCGVLDRVTSFRDSLSDKQASPGIDNPGTTDQEPAADLSLDGTQATKDVVLYFSDPSGEGLVAEHRTIAMVEGIARETVEELIKGPGEGSSLLPTVPQGTALLDINVKQDGVAVVDFSKELVDNHFGGSSGEALTVYSIVDTLTQFPTVQKVQFLVDGKYVKSISGNLDISAAMARNDDIILQ